MKSVIDNLSSTSGWSASDGTKVWIYGTNQIPDFIAGLNNTESLILKFDDANGKYAQKSVAKDLTNYTELVFHIWSRNKKDNGIDYSLSSDFKYKLTLGSGKEYYIPTFRNFFHLTIDISDVTTMDKIRFTCLHDDEDYLIVSYMLAVRDELPLDIFISTKEQLEYDILKAYGKLLDGTLNKGILLGTVSGSVGDRQITFENGIKFVEKYSVIFIEEGANSETHQIDESEDVDFKFGSMFDGESLLNNYTSANVYLVFPVQYNPREFDIMLPGLTITGMSPEEIILSNKEDTRRDTFTPSEQVKSRTIPTKFRYLIMIDCEARHDELIAIMSQIVRSMIARDFIWVNGKRIDISPEGPGTYIEPTEGFNEIPKIQYIMSIEVKEEIFDRETLVKTVTNTRTYTPQNISQGTLN